jgi:hypothetical protein
MREMEHGTVEDAVRDRELRGTGWGSAGGMEGADGRSEKTAWAGASGWHDDFCGLGSDVQTVGRPVPNIFKIK